MSHKIHMFRYQKQKTDNIGKIATMQISKIVTFEYGPPKLVSETSFRDRFSIFFNRVAATLVHGDGMVAMTVTDQAVVEMREEIGRMVQAYVSEDREGITVTRKLVLATINNMHQDICIMAEDLSVSMIILPFHKDQKQDGRLGLGHSGFRHVNRKV